MCPESSPRVGVEVTLAIRWMAEHEAHPQIPNPAIDHRRRFLRFTPADRAQSTRVHFGILGFSYAYFMFLATLSKYIWRNQECVSASIVFVPSVGRSRLQDNQV